MAKEIKIPVPDQTTEEVRIVKWHKNVGDQVNAQDILLEVETDKAVMEVESPDSGILLERRFEAEEIIPVSEIVGFIGSPGEKVSSAPASTSAAAPSAAPPAPAPAPVPAAEPAPPAAAAPQAPPTAQPVIAAGTSATVEVSPAALISAKKLGVDISRLSGTGPRGKIMRADVELAAQKPAAPAAPIRRTGRILASPNARRLAGELGVDIAQLTGSGPGGRIIGRDVQQFAAAAPRVAPAQRPAPTAAAAPAIPQLAGTEVALTKMRRAIGVNLQKSSRDTPHFNATMAIDMTRAMSVRTEFNRSHEKADRLSVNDLVLKACAEALRLHPTVNSKLKDDKIVYHADINIGVATAVPDGLVVPVIIDTDKLSWLDLARQSKRAAAQARSGKIVGLGKGTFTVSNLGMFGIDNFTAIINPPESAILAVGAVKDEVVAIDGGIGVRPIMKVTLCSDHRVIDGATSAQFLQSVKTYLEHDIAE